MEKEKEINVENTFRDASCDIVLASQIIEHLSKSDGLARALLAGEGNALPRFEKAVDHAVLLVSDPSFIPPRREILVLVEASKPEEDVEAVSKLVKGYSGRAGLRAVGIVVCEEVNDRLLSLVKGLKDAEVVCITKRTIGV